MSTGDEDEPIINLGRGAGSQGTEPETTTSTTSEPPTAPVITIEPPDIPIGDLPFPDLPPLIRRHRYVWPVATPPMDLLPWLDEEEVVEERGFGADGQTYADSLEAAEQTLSGRFAQIQQLGRAIRGDQDGKISFAQASIHQERYLKLQKHALASWDDVSSLNFLLDRGGPSALTFDPTRNQQVVYNQTIETKYVIRESTRKVPLNHLLLPGGLFEAWETLKFFQAGLIHQYLLRTIETIQRVASKINFEDWIRTADAWPYFNRLPNASDGKIGLFLLDVYEKHVSNNYQLLDRGIQERCQQVYEHLCFKLVRQYNPPKELREEMTVPQLKLLVEAAISDDDYSLHQRRHVPIDLLSSLCYQKFNEILAKGQRDKLVDLMNKLFDYSFGSDFDLETGPLAADLNTDFFQARKNFYELMEGTVKELVMRSCNGVAPGRLAPTWANFTARFSLWTIIFVLDNFAWLSLLNELLTTTRPPIASLFKLLSKLPEIRGQEYNLDYQYALGSALMAPVPFTVL